ncbi:MAG: hypothetical protein JKY22_05990, partial [Flavobacteriaceae bacterium]|nr:hypothetical protein [Flavobacteriaceae bacterium]
MKKYLCILSLFLTISQVTGQEEEPKISLEFENTSIKEVLLMIEQQTSYQVYFVEDWFSEEKPSGSYQNVSLDVILSEVLNGTLLNYYIGVNTSIILTNNNGIYDSLPEGFFNAGRAVIATTDTNEEEIIAPVFYNEANTSEARKIETIRIGKEDPNSGRKQFILT